MTAEAEKYSSRVLRGLCHWDKSLVEDAIEELKKSDAYTWSKIDGLMREAESNGGLPANGRKQGGDYRTPLDFAPRDVVDPPWTGELKVKGKKRKKLPPLDWRLYFGEPCEREDHVIACGIGSKAPEDLKGVEKQIKQVAKAMGRFKWYCRTHQLTYPPFEP